eukprot:3596316-Rhodomonas_salina.1
MAGDTAALERSIPLVNPPTHLGRTRTNQADKDSWTPGHYACFYGHAPFLHALFQRGASPHAENLNKCTLLHFAAGRGNLACVRVLLEAGANPNAADDDRMTPFLRCEELKPDGWDVISVIIRLCCHLQPTRSCDGSIGICLRKRYVVSCDAPGLTQRMVLSISGMTVRSTLRLTSPLNERS